MDIQKRFSEASALSRRSSFPSRFGLRISFSTVGIKASYCCSWSLNPRVRRVSKQFAQAEEPVPGR